ncbi:MAG: flavin reductase family protein [Gemmatimonadetes bacterium]|nr:flavin reductase family protein [Gemmatimonadota bacterium]MBT8479105.1 flavin reductase family protein [Gemmatimonadota bacterium]NNK49951.1 flavin reductase family protein [Gemmatimonadota bacterium]
MMSVGPRIFREVMGRLAGGVTVVTALDGDRRARGFTATAVCSVSLDPPLVLVCVGREAHTPSAIRHSGRYALNFLCSDDAATSDRFATEGSKFDGIEWHTAPAGSPLLPGILAWVECEVEQDVEAGDHTVFIGRVTAAAIGRTDRDPLVHFGGRYHTVAAMDP